MDPTTLVLARLQFAATTIYHFFFVPLTLGLSIIIAVMQTMYLRTKNEEYKKMAQFWGKLFLINFAMGVVTGIVQEFQFGMNWSEYSRFVGDVFGAPLAIEALIAFFLESTFIGIWIFGWDKLPKALHATSIWIVAIAANLSALWILIANSFMQHPQLDVAIAVENNRAVLKDFGALIGNPYVWHQFPHVFFSGLSTASFFIMGISAFHLLKKSPQLDIFKKSFKIGLTFGIISVLFVMMFGHLQGQYMVQTQPMKMAAAEALWNNTDPANLSLFAIPDTKKQENAVDITFPLPGFLSFLTYHKFDGVFYGLNDVQNEYEQKYGANRDYKPPIEVAYWSFRIMVGAGLLMFFMVAIGFLFQFKDRILRMRWYLFFSIAAILLPYLANSFGWILTEVGRQPWIVFGLLTVENAVSPSIVVDSTELLISLVVFCLIYLSLMLVDVFLLRKYAVAGISDHK